MSHSTPYFNPDSVLPSGASSPVRTFEVGKTQKDHRRPILQTPAIDSCRLYTWSCAIGAFMGATVGFVLVAQNVIHPDNPISRTAGGATGAAIGSAMGAVAATIIKRRFYSAPAHNPITSGDIDPSMLLDKAGAAAGESPL
jgi:hypothetical protein